MGKNTKGKETNKQKKRCTEETTSERKQLLEEAFELLNKLDEKELFRILQTLEEDT